MDTSILQLETLFFKHSQCFCQKPPTLYCSELYVLKIRKYNASIIWIDPWTNSSRTQQSSLLPFRNRAGRQESNTRLRFTDLHKFRQQPLIVSGTASNRSPLYYRVAHCARGWHRWAKFKSIQVNPRVQGARHGAGYSSDVYASPRPQSGPPFVAADFKVTSKLIITITSHVSSSHVRFYERDEHGAMAATGEPREARKERTTSFKATRLIS